MRADVVVIGGGAAGLMAAGTAAERGLRVVLCEPNRRLGRKLRITGKGRCNVTNQCTPQQFMENIPTNSKFLYSSVNAFPPAAAMEFFETLGVPLKTERGRRVFPRSDKADDIADSLAAWTKRNGVTWLHTCAEGILTDDVGVTGVSTPEGNISCGAAILCTGGLSYPGTGSTGAGHRLAAGLGHTIVAPRASLVPLESAAPFCRELSGLSLRNVGLTALEDGKAVYREQGEMLFAHFGVTGPLVLSASAHMRKWGTKEYCLSIDLKPALDEEKLDNRILRDFEKFCNRDFANALDELAPRTLIPVLVELSGIPGDKKVHSVTREQRRELVRLFKGLEIPVTGPRPVAEAIVTAGGFSVKEVNPRTMASKLVPGLYFAGELLDVDGYTGGYNLQIAWATGRCAGRAVTIYREGE
ncbi:MAG: NAD(P)/FAD-dependent oxidoreductase [Oscillospiraceae bacterium]|nr:NAD(P)/FAD-dependent oxidoreductase [Oscillospiraceae bacterium]